MNKCLERVNDLHFWNPGVFSYAMILRCCPNSRVFFHRHIYSLWTVLAVGWAFLGSAWWGSRRDRVQKMHLGRLFIYMPLSLRAINGIPQRIRILDERILGSFSLKSNFELIHGKKEVVSLWSPPFFLSSWTTFDVDSVHKRSPFPPERFGQVRFTNGIRNPRSSRSCFGVSSRGGGSSQRAFFFTAGFNVFFAAPVRSVVSLFPS